MISEAVATLRRERDISLRKLAKQIGRSAQFVLNVERGQTVPDDRIAEKLAVALGADPKVWCRLAAASRETLQIDLAPLGPRARTVAVSFAVALPLMSEDSLDQLSDLLEKHVVGPGEQRRDVRAAALQHLDALRHLVVELAGDGGTGGMTATDLLNGLHRTGASGKS